MRVLVTGAAGPRGKQIAAAIAADGHEVVGVDREAGEGVERVDYHKRGFEALVRRGAFEGVVHLAVHAGFRLPPEERHRLNIEGTQRVVRLAVEHGVGRLVVASHATVYGALADNPYFMTEDYPPRVGQMVPAMQDLVTADLLATSAMWQHPGLSIVVLRPVHALGPTSRGVLASTLHRGWFPTILGYDPMVQVIHELDVARAFALALSPPSGQALKGAFNVTGPGEVPLSVVLREAGVRGRAVPEIAFRLLRGRFGVPDAMAGAVDFLKHPCLVDGARFVEATGFQPEHGLRETLASMRH